MRPALKMRLAPKPKTLDRKPETGNRKQLRHPLLRADVMGPEGPYGTYFEIHVTPQKFELLKQYNFVRIIVGSVDLKLEKELLLKDIDTFLCLTPNYIPAILLVMDKAEFEEKVSSHTAFRLNDGTRTRDYLLAHMTDRKQEYR